MGTDSSNVHEALIFVTIYNKLPWGHRQLLRLSQHVLLSSQTLGDLFKVIPCQSEAIFHGPGNVLTQDSGETPNGTDTSRESGAGAVMCIDGTLYGDGQVLGDYAEFVTSTPPIHSVADMQNGSLVQESAATAERAAQR